MVSTNRLYSNLAVDSPINWDYYNHHKMKGAIFLKISMRNCTIITLVVAAFFFIFPVPSKAAEGDILVSLTYKEGAAATAVGTGILRAGDLWVPADSMARMGVTLSDGLKGKGFYVNVANPAEVLGIPALTSLVGGSLPLYFPLLKDNGVSYFNVTGMEPLTKLSISLRGESAVLTRTNDDINAVLAARTPKPGVSGKKIMLVWAHITRFNPDLGAEAKINALNVVSPTWFNLIDGNGGVANRASVSYVEAAHKKGYQVWALASNGFSSLNTTQMFASKGAVNIYIARLLAYAKLYNLDGINIDFEGMAESDNNAFVNFMSVLGPQLSAMGLKSSVDVHVPANSRTSRSHNRAGLAKYSDYIMLMAYDEHWRTSKTAGSVASLPWVERAVQNTLAEGVPAEKLILGVPFYMRKWEETPAGGGVKVKSFTLKMAESDSLISSLGLQPVWNEKTGQYFYSYRANGKTYKVWAEDGESMAHRIALVHKYGLPGAAAWSKGHEKPQIWDVIDKGLNR